MVSKEVPEDWRLVMDARSIARSVSRISYEIVERDGRLDELAIVGIHTGGEHIARRIHKRIAEQEGVEVAFGVIDITLYRDDLWHSVSQPKLKGTHLPFSVSGQRIVLVDDVLYTGRTVRAALDAIIDFGRPQRVELAALVDRGHRELPIRPDYVGKNIPSQKEQFVRARFTEMGFEEDGVYLIESSRGKPKAKK